MRLNKYYNRLFNRWIVDLKKEFINCPRTVQEPRSATLLKPQLEDNSENSVSKEEGIII